MPNSKMASPSDSALNQLLMKLMSPNMQQAGTIAIGAGQRMVDPNYKAPPPTTPTIFDQSQQPVLGNVAPRRPVAEMPQQEQFPRLPQQMISPSPEMMAKLLAQTMFPGKRR